MEFNYKLPHWENAGVEPSPEWRRKGYEAGESPAANTFNWFLHTFTGAINEIQGTGFPVNFGDEPVKSTEEDTFETWTEFGTGYALYATVGLLNGQPSQYGVLLNFVVRSNVAQLWFAMPQGTMYYRGGNGGGLANTWTKILNSAQMSEILLDKLGGTLPVEKGGTGKTKASDAFTVLARRESIGTSNLVNADTLTETGIHQVYFEGSTHNPADYNFPYAYGVLVVDSTVSYVGQLFYAVSANKLWYRTRATTSSAWGSWCRVYDTKNKPTLDELGAADASTHNIKTYTNLSQLGLSNGATMLQVAKALPGSSSLRIYVLTSENAKLAPTATNGWLEVNRPATNHVEFRYTTTSRMCYYAVVLNVNNSNEQLSEWTQIANFSDLNKNNVGLGNVPNVSTNDQTPTYSDTTNLQTLASGEKLNVAFQKIKCAITNLINHLNNKSNPHNVTASQIGLNSEVLTITYEDGTTGTLEVYRK